MFVFSEYICIFMMSFVACTSDNSDNPAIGIDARIVGNWLNTNLQYLDSNPQKGGGGKI